MLGQCHPGNCRRAGSVVLYQRVRLAARPRSPGPSLLVLGRNWIADFCESVTGWGPAYRRFCAWFWAIGGVLLVITVAVDAVRLLL